MSSIRMPKSSFLYLLLLLFVPGPARKRLVRGAPPNTAAAAAAALGENNAIRQASHYDDEPKDQEKESTVPVVDLSRPNDDEQLIQEIARACQDPGFFQVVNHGIDSDLIQRFRKQCELYFDLPDSMKQGWKRSKRNARGYFDDEYTKQKMDWKEALDVGVPGSKDWTLPDDDPQNHQCCDGLNLFPHTSILPEYRQVTVEYFHACEALSKRLTLLMAKGLHWLQQTQQNKDPDSAADASSYDAEEDPFLLDMAANHSSYLRTNYYRPYSEPSSSSTLGISPHKDAGFVTVLLQDDDCHSLQVPRHGTHGDWMTVSPIPGALTINTGDMAQIWSNNAYRAPLHRVLTSTKRRYSAPFFYNPPYHTTIQPMSKATDAKFHPVLWAYFRAVRFAGDWTDLGVEIQIEHFLKDLIKDAGEDSMTLHHLQIQELFQKEGMDEQPFDVEQYAALLSSVRKPRNDDDATTN